MVLRNYKDFCYSLPATTHVVQWRGSQVWKVGGKAFVISRWGDIKYARVTFKVSELAYETPREQPGLRPAPNLGSRGMKWVQHYNEPGLSNDDLKSYLGELHLIVSRG